MYSSNILVDTIIYVCNLKETYLIIKLIVLSKIIIEHIYKLLELLCSLIRDKNYLYFL